VVSYELSTYRQTANKMYDVSNGTYNLNLTGFNLMFEKHKQLNMLLFL